MGALHEGHLSLIRQGRKENDSVVVSIFVNPIQFGPHEDYRRYPRNLSKDMYLCRKEGVDVIYYPRPKDMYAGDFKTYVEVKDLSQVLCGKSRPGHFRGVATVVTKLFNIVEPDVAYFGQKDMQQAVIIKKMVSDLNMPIKVKVMPIVREEDGLAMSSRNAYLNPQERKEASILYQALIRAEGLIKKGKRDSQYIIKKMKGLINSKRSTQIDYIEIVDLDNLKPLKTVKGKVLIALAVWVGRTRLIDNIIVAVK
jgi:pantoate--beta-alanine ligase